MTSKSSVSFREGVTKLKAVIERHGGAPWLEQVLMAFYEAMNSDILVGFFFAGKDLASIAARQKAFIMKATGLAKDYSGKPPTLAHLELPNIQKGHFDRRLLILRQTLQRFGLNEDEQKIWIQFEDRFRAGIVSAEGPR